MGYGSIIIFFFIIIFFSLLFFSLLLFIYFWAYTSNQPGEMLGAWMTQWLLNRGHSSVETNFQCFTISKSKIKIFPWHATVFNAGRKLDRTEAETDREICCVIFVLIWFFILICVNYIENVSFPHLWKRNTVFITQLRKKYCVYLFMGIALLLRAILWHSSSFIAH